MNFNSLSPLSLHLSWAATYVLFFVRKRCTLKPQLKTTSLLRKHIQAQVFTFYSVFEISNETSFFLLYCVLSRLKLLLRSYNIHFQCVCFRTRVCTSMNWKQFWEGAGWGVGRNQFLLSEYRVYLLSALWPPTNVTDIDNIQWKEHTVHVYGVTEIWMTRPL